MESISKSITVATDHVQNVFGQFDANAKKIEKAFSVTMIFRDDKLKISGEETSVDKAIRVMSELIELSERGNIIDAQKVDYSISMATGTTLR